MNKLCVITGATSGIGKATALSLFEKGIELVVIGRSKGKGEELVKELEAINQSNKVTYYQADLSIQKEVIRVANQVLTNHANIDILINNAGAVFSQFELTDEGIEKTIANNHLAYFVLTLKLLPKLLKSIMMQGLLMLLLAHTTRQVSILRVLLKRRTIKLWKVIASLN